MYEAHPLETQESSNSMECSFCSDRFQSKADLMVHQRSNHIDKVQLCVNLDGRNCDFGDGCWFSHDPSSTKTCKVYSCNYCELQFKIKSKFMKHRKTMHSEFVQNCQNEDCQHGSHNCWFIHKETKNDKSENMNESNIENNYERKSQNDEWIQKIMEMLEKYSQRIIILENLMIKNTNQK